MDRPEFLERVLGSRSELIIETWDIVGGKAKRVTVPFEKATKISGDDVFFMPPNGTHWAIISDSDDRETTLAPSTRVETSPSRYDSYFFTDEALSPKQVERLLPYLDPLSPPRMTQTFRMPGTTSTKRGEPFTARIVDTTGHVYSVSQILGLALPTDTVEAVDPEWLRGPGPFEAGNTKQALLWLQKKATENKALGKGIRSLLEKKDTTPRSVMQRLIRAGLTEREAIWCAEASVCNPYKHWRYGVRAELAKLLLISRVKTGGATIASKIHDIRATKTKDKPFVIRDKMAKAALEDFQANTVVANATDGTRWAIDRHTGMAMELIRGSEPINHYIMRRYGINPVDQDHRHLLEEMILMAASKPATTEATAISWFERDTLRMRASFGGREVVILSPDGVAYEENGANGVLFRPVPRADLLSTKLIPVDRMLDEPVGAWWERLLPMEHLANLTRGRPEEASALLHVWTIFFLFRNIAASRPLLIALGPAGSGKTTFSKKLHLLFYGNGVKLFEVTRSQPDWTTTTSNYPLALFDNVDAPSPWWLPAACALAITPTDATKRSLYSNNTPYTARMDAMVGLSSHDAAFLKDDVIDRALLIQSRRIEDVERLEEQPMFDAILRDREELLGGLLADVIHVLRTPRPGPLRGSAIRIVDFNAIGTWIARGIGKEQEFKSAIGTLSIHQKAKVLEEDITLVMALEDMQRVSHLAEEWVTHTQIWTELISLAEDNGDALKSQYKNSHVFGRKLLAIATQLRDSIGLEMQDDPARGWKVFKLGAAKRRKEGR